MIKRTLPLAILVALAVGLAVPGMAPVTAAPSSAGADAPNARLLSADTALYVDFRTGDLTKTVDFVLDLVQKVTGNRPTNVYSNIDQDLTRMLGREASFEKDVLPWLGDHLTAALPITGEQVAALETNPSSVNQLFANPDYIVILSVNDDAAAGSFLKELLGKTQNMTFSTRTENVAGTQATVYDQGGMCEITCGSVVQAKGFLVAAKTLVVNSWLSALKEKKAMLAQSTGFGKVMNALKPNNLLTVYLSPRFYAAYFAVIQARMQAPSVSSAATPEATGQDTGKLMKLAFGAIEGQAFGLRHDGKVLAFDIAQSINMDALAQAYKELGLSDAALKAMMPTAIDAKLASQIPAKALVAIIGGGLPSLYDGFKAGLTAAEKFGGQMGGRGQAQLGQIERSFNQFEAYLKVGFDLDLRQDILGWMTGEFAVDMLYNPNSVLAKASNTQWPFDHALLIQTGDAAKTKNFLTKLNAGLEKNAQLTPTSAGDNLYRVELQKGVSIAYGLLGNTFVLATASGLDNTLAAAKGDGVLSASPVWKNAQASMVKPASQIWFVNIAQITPLVKAFATLRRGGTGDAEQAVKLLELFESASISVGVVQPDGLSLSSVQLIMK
jgi:Protein of unknown function (DUF3352)